MRSTPKSSPSLPRAGIRHGRLAALAGVAAVLSVSGWIGCAPRLTGLAGPGTTAQLPPGTLAAGYRKIGFTWELVDPNYSARGDGVARIAPPDSVRLDFFLAGGFGGGAAILIDDSLDAPGVDLLKRLIPPPPMLWAAFGRSSIPTLADTVKRFDGGILRADIGNPAQWRLSFRDDSLIRLDRIGNGRVLEWVEHGTPGEIEYHNSGAHRALTLRITSVVKIPSLDASIWHIPQ